MSTEDDNNKPYQVPKENYSVNSHRRLFNKYACACVMTASIISAIFGYGEWFSVLVPCLCLYIVQVNLVWW